MKRSNLFTYDDYRKFLRDWYAWMKKTRPEFSYRAFSQWAGFKSPNQLLLVMNNQRNISITTVDRYSKVLKFGQTERKYFELLVKFNQARDMPSKKRLFQELSAYWLRKGTFLAPEQHAYLTNWYYSAVREMVNLKGFKENGRWISKRLGQLITPAQAEKAIQILLEMKLLKRDEKKRLIQGTHYLTTGDEVESVASFMYHEQMMRLAEESLKQKPSSERNITALTFTIKKEDYEPVVAEITSFRKKVIALLQNRSVQNEDESLYQLNIHLFPITKE